MAGHRISVGLGSGLAAVVLLSGCVAGPTSSPGPIPTATPVQTATPSAAAATPTPTPAPTLAAGPVVIDIPYETSSVFGLPKRVDVYAPSTAGSWPVVVMLHGGELWKGFYEEWATLVAAEGFVVFVPAWSSIPDVTAGTSVRRQVACAVSFAQAHGTEYGGDAATLIVFGHSAGANLGAQVAFRRPDPEEGCLGGEELGPVSALVTFEGDWLSMDPLWDPLFAAKPDAIEDAAAPWAHLADQPDLRVVMLVSDGSGGVVDPPVIDPPVDLATARDALALRSAYLAAGERPDVAEEQAILYAALKAQGSPVSLTELPGSGHSTIGAMGMPVFLAAFHEAAGP